jgi:hypothetical protein
LAIEDLWNFLHSDPDSIDPALVKRIAEFWQVPVEVYDCMSGEGSSVKLGSLNFRNQWFLTPGLHWHGAWETAAEDLLTKQVPGRN